MKACAAKHHHRVFNALFPLVKVWFEHFQLDANASGVATQQKFRVCKSQAMGIGMQYRSIRRVIQQVGPGIGHALFCE